jgi:hypothetical protein
VIRLRLPACAHSYRVWTGLRRDKSVVGESVKPRRFVLRGQAPLRSRELRDEGEGNPEEVISDQRLRTAFDSCAPAHLTLAPSPTRALLPSQFYLDHSHCLVLAPATLAALPSTRAIPDRDVFYVAHPIRSIREQAVRPGSEISAQTLSHE